MTKAEPLKNLKSLLTTGNILLILLLTVTLAVLSFFSYKGGLVPVKDSSAAFAPGMNAINEIGFLDWDQYPEIVPVFSTITAPANRLAIVPASFEIDTINHKLFVADNNYARVFIYNLDSNNQLLDRIPDYIWGQSSYNAITNPSISASTINRVADMLFDPATHYLYVSDQYWNRVLVFDTTTITSQQAATYVLGQPDFTTSTYAVTQSGMYYPWGLALDSATNRLFVSNTNANRVTVYDVSTITNGEPAINVIGQADFTSNVTTVTQQTTRTPHGLAFDSNTNYLYVAQRTPSRVTIFDVSSITDGEAAINVLGQALYTTSTGSYAATGLSIPQGLELHNNRLLVSTGNRVVFFDITAITDGEAAVNVIGQTAFGTNTQGLSQSQMYSINNIFVDATNNYLYVGDSVNRRAMVFDIASVTDGENAINMFGQSNGSNFYDPQPTYTKNGYNDTPNLWTVTPNDIALDSVHHRLFVADTSRVLVFNLSTQNLLLDNLPDNVIGEPDFGSLTFSSCTQDSPMSVHSLTYDQENDRLFVGDGSGNRILVYDTSTITNGENAANVLGQADFTTCTTLAASANTFDGTYSLIYESERGYLMVSDSSRHRVLVFDVNTIVDNEPAVHVLGQTDFTSSGSGLQSNNLYNPTGLAYDYNRNYLFIANTSIPAIFVYDLNEIVDGESAINVIGQDDFGLNVQQASQNHMLSASGLAFDSLNNHLYFSDIYAHRVLLFDTTTLTNGMSAIGVIGQTDYTGATFPATMTQSSLKYPSQLELDPFNKLLYVADNSNFRVMLFDITQNDVVLTETDSSTSLVEGSSGDQINIHLTRQPTADVIIDIVLQGESKLAVDKTSLTFTTSNWETNQTVTITSPQDSDFNSFTETLTLSVNDGSSDINYTTVENKTASVTVTDNSVAGVIINTIDNKTSEAKESGQFSVVLTAIPDSAVTINLKSSNTAEGNVPSSLTIQPADWNNSVKNTITITGVDDVIPEIDGNISYQILTESITTSDAHYSALTGAQIADIEMVNDDNDLAGVTVTTASQETTEAGGEVTVSFKLLTKPKADTQVDLPLTISNTNEAKLSSDHIIISAESWDRDDLNKIIVTGVDDFVADGNLNFTLATGNPLSNDPDYDSLVAESVADLEFLNIDNEVSGIKIEPSSLEIHEGSSKKVEVVLTSQPTAELLLEIASSSDKLKLSHSELLFNNENWNVAQEVGVEAPVDSDTQESSALITVKTSDELIDALFPPAQQTLAVKLLEVKKEIEKTDTGKDKEVTNAGLSGLVGTAVERFNKLEPVQKVVLVGSVVPGTAVVVWAVPKLANMGWGWVLLMKKKKSQE